jgi:polysaccharide deacetylase 2 family uncharacterized protein YibQ
MPGVLALLAAAALLIAVQPATAGNGTAYVAIIIDDLGNNWNRDLDVVNLPGPVACAVMPQLAFSTDVANAASAQHKEVLLHLPLEPVHRKELLGAGGLTRDLETEALAQSLRESLQTVPHAVGINNHLGSLFTQDAVAMGRLMAAMQEVGPGLFFVDSLTTNHSRAKEQATAYGIPSLARSVFLDNRRSESAIERQFDKTIASARKHGVALAIGHPYPETVSVLKRRLPELQQGDVRLVPVSLLVALKLREQGPWQ